MGEGTSMLGERARERGLSLRPIGSADEPFLYRVYASTREDELAQVDWDEAQKAAFLRMQFDAQHKFYSEQFAAARFDVIVHDGADIGRLYVRRWDDEIRVIDIALLTEHRGGGLGGAVMADLLDEAAGAGQKVTIHVERNNPAMHLYERLGFAPVEDKGVYKLMEWRAPEA